MKVGYLLPVESEIRENLVGMFAQARGMTPELGLFSRKPGARTHRADSAGDRMLIFIEGLVNYVLGIFPDCVEVIYPPAWYIGLFDSLEPVVGRLARKQLD